MEKLPFQWSCRAAGLGLALLLLSAFEVAAQSIVDGRRVEFTPSADNDAVDSGGAPILTNYSLQIFVAGDAIPVQTVTLGKPLPEPDGMMRCGSP